MGPGETPHPEPLTAMARSIIAAELEALRWHWGDAYEIEWDEEHGWRCKRRDGLGDWIHSADPDGLNQAIGADYRMKKVPRP